MTTTPRSIAAVDVPLAQLEPAAVLLEAAARTHSPSDRLAYSLDAELLLHPEKLAVDVPAGWDHHIAQLVKLNGLHAEVAAYRALELGDRDGRVSASCDNPEHPTWLRAPDDTRGCPWCRIDEVRAEALAEAKDEVVEWLVKKAREGTDVSRLADKVERGAIRLFFDAERSAAAPVPQHYDKVPDPLDGCHWCACGNRWPCKHAPAVAA